MKQPNILYIHSHDTGRYVQPYGHDIPTPNIQRLAEGGVLFRQAFSAAPTCSPSRASLLTGQCAHSSGMLGLAHRGFSLKDYDQHILHTLRKAGYHSALIGFQHIASWDKVEVIGYDGIADVENWHVEHVAPAALDFLSHDPPQPFFLSVGFSETHREYPSPGPQDDPRYCLPPPTMLDTPQTRRDMAAFKASARILDQGIGAVLEALEANDLSEDTLVICTTDHGIDFPGMKCNLTDHGIGVMLIMRGPGGFAGGRVCDAMVSHVDLFPTLCDLLEVEQPAWLQGQSMMGLIRGEAEQIRDEIFAEVTYHAAYEPKRALRTRRWKYIRRFDERQAPVLPNCDDSPSKDVWLQHGWRERPVASEQLYDLVFDPNETHNLAGDPSMSAVLGEMRDRLDRWMQATDDPLLRGPVPAPSGARVNDPDGLSPREPTQVIP
ncbi:MAG: sulfatase [Chloroflexota bacterium]|nr:sulfatase [Chloroflexota bacterium]